MRIKSYEEAIDYLEGFIGKIRFRIDDESLRHHDPLERMRVLLDLLDNPQNKFRSVLVGGTSGKGSTAYLISHILTTAGYKTGLTLSPHLQTVNERLQINGEQISDTNFADSVKSIAKTVTQMEKMNVGAPSYFEIIIAIAFKYFADQKVDIAVVEVGMGGEYDATNTLYPLIAVLTNVSLDHTNVLGGTVEKIARTKAGIVKDLLRPITRGSVAGFPATPVKQANPAFGLRSTTAPLVSLRAERVRGVGSPSAHTTPRLTIITGVKQRSVIKIIEDKCKKTGAKLLRLGRDFSYKIRKESPEGSVFDFYSSHSDPELAEGEESNEILRLKPQYDNLLLSLLGEYQVENANLAIETVLQLGKFACLPAGRGFKVSEDDIRKALKTAFFAGRFEILRRASLAQDKMSTTLILDGAHNPTKMKEFLKSLKKLFPKNNPTSLKLRGARKIFVVGFKFDKDVKKMLKQILQVANSVVVTKFHVKTDLNKNASMKIKSIKYYVSSSKYNGNVYYEENLKLAIDKAFQISGRDDLIIVTGSLYLVGEVRNML